MEKRNVVRPSKRESVRSHTAYSPQVDNRPRLVREPTTPVEAKSPRVLTPRTMSPITTPTTPRVQTPSREYATPTTPSKSPHKIIEQLNSPKTPERSNSPGAKTGGKNKVPKKPHSETEIQTQLDGYLNIHRTLWDRIPVGAHVRYFRTGQEARNLRYRTGGFVRTRYANDEGKKFLIIENKPNGHAGMVGYVKFPVAYEDIDELWKKYDRGAFIEIHMISASLSQKKKQIEALEARVNKLETLLSAVVDRIVK